MFTSGQLLPERLYSCPTLPPTPLSLSQVFFFSPVLNKARRKSQAVWYRACSHTTILSRQNRKGARVHFKGRRPQTKRPQFGAFQYNIFMGVVPSTLVNDSVKTCAVPNIQDIGSKKHLGFRNHRCSPGSDHTASSWPQANSGRVQFTSGLWSSWVCMFCVHLFTESCFPSTVLKAEDVELSRSDVVPAIIVCMPNWKRQNKKRPPPHKNGKLQ